MFTLEERPVTVAVHPRLIDELKKRKEVIEKETGRKARGGLTTFSEMAAMELKAIRDSGNKIMMEILRNSRVKELPVKKVLEMGVEREYVSYEIFKKLLVLSSVLSRKKDQTPIQLEVTKIRGLKKNEITYFWRDEA